MRRGAAGASMNIKSTILQLKSAFQTPRRCIRSFGGPERPKSIKSLAMGGEGQGLGPHCLIAVRLSRWRCICDAGPEIGFEPPQLGDGRRWQEARKRFFFPSSLFSCLGSFLLFLWVFFLSFLQAHMWKQQFLFSPDSNWLQVLASSRWAATFWFFLLVDATENLQAGNYCSTPCSFSIGVSVSVHLYLCEWGAERHLV